MLAVVFELDGACLAWRKLGEVAAPGQFCSGVLHAAVLSPLSSFKTSQSLFLSRPGPDCKI